MLIGIVNLQDGDVINSFPNLFYHGTLLWGKVWGLMPQGTLWKILG